MWYTDDMDEPIQDAIDALMRVLNVHENHVFPVEDLSFQCSIELLKIMQRKGLR